MHHNIDRKLCCEEVGRGKGEVTKYLSMGVDSKTLNQVIYCEGSEETKYLSMVDSKTIPINDIEDVKHSGIKRGANRGCFPN